MRIFRFLETPRFIPPIGLQKCFKNTRFETSEMILQNPGGPENC